MANVFSQLSEQRLATCHEDLISIARAVIIVQDCTVVEGHRSPERQEELYAMGRSKLRANESKHNAYPSRAIDLAPYYANETPRIPWDTDTDENLKRWARFAGIVLGIAHARGVRIRWGGDWDGDGTMNDQSFHDLGHFELV